MWRCSEMHVFNWSRRASRAAPLFCHLPTSRGKSVTLNFRLKNLFPTYRLLFFFHFRWQRVPLFWGVSAARQIKAAVGIKHLYYFLQSEVEADISMPVSRSQPPVSSTPARRFSRYNFGSFIGWVKTWPEHIVGYHPRGRTNLSHCALSSFQWKKKNQ